MNKQKIMLKMIFSGCCALILLGLLLGLLNQQRNTVGFWAYDGQDSSDKSLVVINEQALTENIDALAISWPAGGVKVLPEAGDQVRIIEKALSDKSRPLAKIAVDQGYLSIDWAKRWWPFGFGLNSQSKKHCLEIYLPKKIYQSVAISGASGEYVLNELETKKLLIELSSGKVELGRIKADQTQFELTSGRINAGEIIGDKLEMDLTSGNIEVGGRFQAIEVDVTSGNVHIENQELPDDFRADVTSGNIELLIPENNGFTVNVDAVSGRFSGNFDYQIDNKIYRYKSGGPTYQVELVGGQVRIDQLGNDL